MMTWNIRLVDMSTDKEPYIEIREVYYDQLGKPLGHCPAPIGGEDMAEIRKYLEWIIEAVEKPVLKFDNSFKGINGNE